MIIEFKVQSIYGSNRPMPRIYTDCTRDLWFCQRGFQQTVL